MGLFDTFKKATASKRAVVPTPAVPGNTDSEEGAQSLSVSQNRVIEKHLLFVSVAADWFHIVERDLRRLQPLWGCVRVETAQAAVLLLQDREHYAVVMNAPAAGEPGLVAAIERQKGFLVRIILCASTDRAEMARWSAAGGNPLPQSTDGAGLSANVSRISQVQEWMADAGMKKLLGQCRKLPAIPKLYSQVTAELSSPNGSIDVVAQCISQDPVMTAKLLQVVNSAFFALGREVSEPTEAVMFLGAERTRSLILLAGVFTQFENVKCSGFSAEQMWNHSLQVGALARAVAMAETKIAKLAEAAFTAGLVHDMGKLILAANVPTMCAAIDQLQAAKNLTQRDAELAVLGTTHAELAACLLGTWGLPLPVLEAVAWHHAPLRSKDAGFSLLTAVHAANVFAHELSGVAGRKPRREKFDHRYLDQVGMGERRNDWRKACNVPARQEEDAEHATCRARREAKVN